MINIGDNIKSLRLSRGMTQQQLADVVGAKTYTTITKWEKGDNVPQGKDLIALSQHFKVSVDSILGINGESLILPSNQYTYYPTAISAGLPLDIEAITNADKITLPDSIMGKHAGCKDIIILRINGDSMDKVMPDNSLIAVKPTTLDNLNNGDIVVFSDNHDYSVKHYYRQNDTLIFKPNSNNAAHFDQTYNVDSNIVIHGKVVMYIVNLD